MDLFLSQYTPEDQHRTNKITPNWKSENRKIIFQTSKPSFLRGSMLIFQAVTPPPLPKKKYLIISHRCLPMSSARIIALHRAAHLSWYRGWLATSGNFGNYKKKVGLSFVWVLVWFFCVFLWKKTNKHKAGFQHTYDSQCVLLICHFGVMTFELIGWSFK